MRVIVGIADMKVSNNDDAVLVNYSLASCIGIAIYDSVAKVGGILHYMLPDSTLHPDKAEKKPYMFADTGIPPLFKSAYQLGAQKERLKVYVVGASEVLEQESFFNIGERNYLAANQILSRNNVKINSLEIGGNVNRTIRLEIKTGCLWLKISGQEERKLT